MNTAASRDTIMLNPSCLNPVNLKVIKRHNSATPYSVQNESLIDSFIQFTDYQ